MPRSLDEITERTISMAATRPEPEPDPEVESFFAAAAERMPEYRDWIDGKGPLPTPAAGAVAEPPTQAPPPPKLLNPGDLARGPRYEQPARAREEKIADSIEGLKRTTGRSDPARIA